MGDPYIINLGANLRGSIAQTYVGKPIFKSLKLNFVVEISVVGNKIIQEKIEVKERLEV